jgi:hypothetical protein
MFEACCRYPSAVPVRRSGSSWRQEFGGLKNDQVKRLKELERENTRLRRAISDLTLDKLSSGRCGSI